MSRASDKALEPPAAYGDSDRFRRVCAQFATGVAVATVRAGDGSPHGLTVNSFTSVSLHPPLVLICVDHRSSVLPHLRAAEYFALSILHEGQESVSNAFAVKPEGRFEGVSWEPAPHGSPLLMDSIGVFECRRSQLIDAGDHAILIGLVTHSECHAGKPLLYFDRGYRTIR